MVRFFALLIIHTVMRRIRIYRYGLKCVSFFPIVLYNLRKGFDSRVLCVCIMHQYINMLTAAGRGIFNQLFHRNIVAAASVESQFQSKY